ncbi:MAG: hypothetical protein ACOYLB_09670 [Phototrophicaceae bacterium]
MPPVLNFKRYKRLWMTVWMLFLMGYALFGIASTPFHGDEGMQVYATIDYYTAFVEHHPQDLITHPPYIIDSRPHLRLINGSVQRYVAGLAFFIAGYTVEDLPNAPGWNWGLGYDENVEGGWLPHPDMLNLARGVSVGFFLMSIVAMGGISWLFRSRLIFYTATVLYALHPILLLNSRRAMMEGSLLCFGLLTVWVTLLMIERSERMGGATAWQWLGLTLVAGLTLASKHTGAIFLVACWTSLTLVLVRQWQRHPRRSVIGLGGLVLSGMGAIALFWALSPALWDAPSARFQDLLATRNELLNIQVSIDPLAPTALWERALTLVQAPYLTPVMYFELDTWTSASAIQTQIQRYSQSAWAGYSLEHGVGVVLTLLAVWGLVSLFRDSSSYHLSILIWLGWTCVALMLNPLPWQRYYLPYIPICILLCALGLDRITKDIQNLIRLNLRS